MTDDSRSNNNDGSSTPLNLDYDVEISANDMDEIKLGVALADAAAAMDSTSSDEGKIPPLPVFTEEKPSKKRELAKNGGTLAPTVSRRKKKPKGMPKRPLSAYNVFFQNERVKVLEQHNGAPDGARPSVSFEELGRTIGARWKTLSEDEKKKYEILAQEDSVRYRNEMEVFKETKRRRTEEKNKAAELCEPPAPSTKKVFSSPPDIKPPFFFPLQARLPGQPSPPPVQQQQEERQPEWQRRQEQQQPEASFPIPPGTEVVLSDPSGRERTFKVQYKFYTMTRIAAETYMENLHRMQFGFNEQQEQPPPPQQQRQQSPPPPSRDYRNIWG